MRWVLDDGTFDTLADFGRPELLAYPPGRLVVAPSTAQAATDSEARARLLRLETPNGHRLFEIFEILLDGEDPAAAIFLELHREAETSVNRAEREAIAWALARADDAVFVTEDKLAALIALAELGRTRVAHPFDLWIELREADAVTPADFKRLCDRTKGRDQRLPRMPGRAKRHFGQE